MSQEVLQKLLDGNSRFAANAPERPRQNIKRRAEIAEHQHPKAIVVTCSDSRVCPEIIFDQGLGDLFVIRTAGQVCDNVALGSIEYAVEHLGASLILVLGHERCGAVTAAVSAQTAPGYINHIVQAIQPAVTIARKQQDGDIIARAVRANVALVIQQITSASPFLRERIQKQGLVITGGYYHLEAGAVSLISPEEQGQILAA